MTIVKRPLLISIVGPAKIGVNITCLRVKYALDNLGKSAEIITLRSLQDVRKFEKRYTAGQLHGYDVVLFDNHHYTQSAIRTGRRDIAFDNAEDVDALKPDMSFLLIATPEDYLRMLKMPPSYDNLQKCRMVLDKYQNCDRKFFGSNNLTIVSVSGEHGRLYGAGWIKNRIMQEL